MGYSTVTLLARLRGLSTSQPRANEFVEGLRRLGDVDHVAALARQLAVAACRHQDHAAAAGLHLLDVPVDLVIHAVARRDDHGGHVAVDERDGAVLHLGGGIALGVNVADFLELQRSLECDGEVVAAAEVEHVAHVLVAVREVADQLVLGEDLLDLGGDGLQRADQAGRAGAGQATHAGQMEGEQGEHDELRGERLRRGHADLAAGVQIDAGVGLAGDRARHHVADGEGRRAEPLGLAQRRQRVRRLA